MRVVGLTADVLSILVILLGLVPLDLQANRQGILFMDMHLFGNSA